MGPVSDGREDGESLRAEQDGIPLRRTDEKHKAQEFVEKFPKCTHAQTADHQTAHTRLLHSYINIKFIIARLLLCQTALARLLLCQTAVFLGLYAPRLPIFLCFCQTAAVWEIGQSGNLKRVVGWVLKSREDVGCVRDFVCAGTPISQRL